MQSIFTTAYFPPIEYMAQLAKSQSVLLEKHENYIKQTYRNRCNILSANELQALSIPVYRPHGNRTKICDVQIDYSTNWNKVHWKAIESAYASSPFYEFFAPEIDFFFNQKHKFLLDFNTEILTTIFDFIQIETKIKFTENFLPIQKDNKLDFRYSIHPKQKKMNMKFEKYEQVFSNKHGFVENLSVLDLIFNLGSESYDYLKRI